MLSDRLLVAIAVVIIYNYCKKQPAQKRGGRVPSEDEMAEWARRRPGDLKGSGSGTSKVDCGVLEYAELANKLASLKSQTEVLKRAARSGKPPVPSAEERLRRVNEGNPSDEDENEDNGDDEALRQMKKSQ